MRPVDAGVYTPTLNNTTNVAASTAYECQYLRIGTTCHVSGKVDVNPTAAAPTATVLGISLPIPSNIGAAEDCAGVAASTATAGEVAPIIGNAANNRATMSWNTIDANNHDMYFTFSYQII